MENQATKKLREYLKIPTIHPYPDYLAAEKFLQDYAKEIGLSCESITLNKGKPIIIMCLPGTKPDLPSILLNSHTDVVPVFPEQWKRLPASVGPMDGYKDENGRIYCRGVQDMKSVGITHLEAMRRIVAKGVKPKRNIYLTFVPDEEVGGQAGMGDFTGYHEAVGQPHEKWIDMKVGFALDEGIPNPDKGYNVYYGERAPWWVKIVSKGQPAHGSTLLDAKDPNRVPAVNKLVNALKRILEFRTGEIDRLKTQLDLNTMQALELGDVTTINITVLNAGVGDPAKGIYSYNVIPSDAWAGLDIRIPPFIRQQEFEAWIKKVCDENGVGYEFYNKFVGNEWTRLDQPVAGLCGCKDEAGTGEGIKGAGKQYWDCIQEVSTKQFDTPLYPKIFPAATDSRFVRMLGVPCLGISPIEHTENLLHDNDEYLDEAVFLRGIDWMERVVINLANLE